MGVSTEFFIEEHDASGVTETQFHMPSSFSTQEATIEASTQAGELALSQQISHDAEPFRIEWFSANGLP